MTSPCLVKTQSNGTLDGAVLNHQRFSEKPIHGALTNSLYPVGRVPGRYHVWIRCAFTGRFRPARRSGRVRSCLRCPTQIYAAARGVRVQVGIAAEMKPET